MTADFRDRTINFLADPLRRARESGRTPKALLLRGRISLICPCKRTPDGLSYHGVPVIFTPDAGKQSAIVLT